MKRPRAASLELRHGLCQVAVGLLKGLHSVEELVLGLTSEGGGHLLELRAVVHVVIQHISQYRQRPLRPLRQAAAVVMGGGGVLGGVIFSPPPNCPADRCRTNRFYPLS